MVRSTAQIDLMAVGAEMSHDVACVAAVNNGDY